MFSAPVAAGCTYGVCWGAVAVGDRGLAARASAMRTAPDAWARADRVCNGKCTQIEVFHSGCGAIVQSGQTARFAGFGSTQEDALQQATAACEASGERACRVRVTACSQ
ncbi:DUF4189 domain-containing protein [Candidatus Rhodobacter oscarellae]|uniref:DUF4189 domain-containing protein n=1 Tax=Candidatus Rhodobacter oscarellae TaxID=1675527 RepID=UPI001F17A6A3|nr:DUF4189 domain-containing protein [Candidatus Rhodobacter lobularis]